MSARLAPRGPDGEGRWTDGPVGLACQLMKVAPESANEVQPLVSASGAVLLFDGRLDNREELLALLPGELRPGRSAPDSECVLAAHGAWGEDFPARLLGDFALALFNPRRQQLLLARDALGVRPLYFCEAGPAFLFATEIKALLAHPNVATHPDEDLLAAYVLEGPSLYDAERTFFAGVSSLPPGTLKIVQRDGFRSRRHWEFDATRQIRFSSVPECAEAYRAHFERAVRRRLRSAYPVAVAVSGGLDSSSIFCTAETLRRREAPPLPSLVGFSCQASDGSLSDERSFLRAIEEQYGVAIQQFPARAVGDLAAWKENLRRVEIPFLATLWANFEASLQHARRAGARVILLGEGGDEFLADRHYLIDLVHRWSWREAWFHLQEVKRWNTDADPTWFRRRFLQDLIRYHIPPAFVPLARKIRAHVSVARRSSRRCFTDAFRGRALRMAMPTRPDRPFTTGHARGLLKTAESMYHLTEWYSKQASANRLEPAFPFLDRELISFLMAVPGEIICWQGVPRGLHRLALGGVLPETIRERRWKADPGHLMNETLRREFSRIAQCLGAEAAIYELGFTEKAPVASELERLRSQLRGQKATAASRLCQLLGMELWLQIFFRQGTQSEELIQYAQAG